MSVQITEILSKNIERIQNEVLTINYEHPSTEYNFERKSQDKISPSNQSFEKPEEELIYFKVEQPMDPKKFLSEQIVNIMVNLTSKTLYSQD